MTISITVTALTAVPNLRGNKLSATVAATGAAAFGGLPYLQLDKVVFYSSTTNDFGTASQIGEGYPEEFVHTGLIEEQTYYYWAKPRNAGGDYGDKYPTSSTAGVACAAAGRANLVNGKIVASVSGGALTFAVKTLAGIDPSATDPVYVAFDQVPAPIVHARVVATINAATSVTFPSGFKFNTAANAPFKLWPCGVYKSGAFYLGAMNCVVGADGTSLLKVQPIPEGLAYSLSVYNSHGAADGSAGLIHLNTTGVADGYVSDCQVRILASCSWEQGLPVAGTWSTVADQPKLFYAGMAKPGDTVNAYSSEQMSSSSALFNDAGTAGAKKPLPLDDTIPQYDEGYFVDNISNALLNVQSASNLMEVEWSVPVAPDAANEYVALMVGQVNGPATAISIERSRGADIAFQMTVKERILASNMVGFAREMRIGYSRTGAVSPANFKVYYGRLAAGRLFGGIWNQYANVREIQG